MAYPNWLSQRAHLSGSRMALSYGDEQWTFDEINKIALDYAGMLVSFGVNSDTRVAILAKSNPESVFVMYACLHLGCEMVMLNERLSAAELKYQLADSEAGYLLVDEELQEKIFSCMSSRASANIQDEMEVLGPVRLTDVQEAQKRIISVARKMSDEGTIVLAGRGGEEMV